MTNEPTFSLDPKMGGMNWGFCRPLNNKGIGAVGKYIAIMETSSVPNSETNSEIRIKLYGDLGITDLSSLGNGFERGSTKKVSFSSPEVGKIQKIKLVLEGSQPFRCKKITIKKGPKTYTFQCLRKLEPCPGTNPKGNNCNMKIESEGNIPYEITVKSSDKPGSGTTSPVILSIIGKKGEGQAKLITDKGIKDNGAKTAKVMADDVGDITGFKLQISEHGRFIPSYVRIKNLNSKDLRIFEIKDVLLTNPGKDTYRKNPDLSRLQGSLSQDKDTEENFDEGQDPNNANGGLLSVEDKAKIIDLKCDQKLENPSSSNQIFGPEFPTKKQNFISVLVRCPGNCHSLKEKVYGTGIHPINSPICISALIDDAMPYFGGIFSVSIFSGIKKYIIGKVNDSKGQEVMDYTGNSKKSFSVFKVDNVDFYEKDFRILNSKGKLSNEGRIEVRNQGDWGTLCALDNNALAAKKICTEIGYRDGEWKNPTDNNAKNFCKSFKNEDYCGVKGQTIHFMAIKCTESDKTFSTCHKVLSDTSKCNHSYDSIIRCFNENFDIETTIPEGVVRLQKDQVLGQSTIGRLEMFKGNEFLPICNLGFTTSSAVIACKTMGFEIGSIINNQEQAKQFQLDLKSKKKFAADNMACSGNEASVKDCNYNPQNIRCKHDQDIVIKCSKGKGDVTGKSQYIKPVINSPPNLGKCVMSRIQLTCEDKGNNEIKFEGDPGSVYIVECPKNCGKTHGTVWGSYSYTSNSHICRAAVHSGVIQDEEGGAFVLGKMLGSKYYEGSDNNNILTTDYLGEWPLSITFTNINSAYENMNKAINPGKKKNFLHSSFISEKITDLTLPIPVFQWIPRDHFKKFSESTSLLINEHNLGMLNNFTILMRFKMTDFKNSKSFLFSYSGCNGFNILINEFDELEIGDVCQSSKLIKLGYLIPLNDKILFYMKHQKGKVHIRIFSYSTKTLFEKKFKHDMKFSSQGAIGLGRMANEKKDFFIGKIDFFQMYQMDVEIKLLDEIIKSIKILPKPGQTISRKTFDNRKCVSDCTFNPVPPSPLAGKPPIEANPYLIYPKVKNSNKGSDKGGPSGTFDKNQAANIETIDIDCRTSLMDKIFSGSPGKIFRVRCKNCMAVRGAVFGTSIYHPLSAICKAASHSGVLPLNKGGVILIQIVVGAKAYNGSTGVDKTISATFAGADRSFIVMKAPPLIKIDCKTSPNQSPFSTGSIGNKFVVLCPSGCSKLKSDIFGSIIYTDNSSICVSAIHYGMLSDKGGEVSFIIEKGESAYKKSRGFGIKSKSKGPHIRSFKFLGNRSAISYTWSEDFSHKFSDKWQINVHPNANNILSNYWTYAVDDHFVLDGNKQKLRAISHTGKISIKSKTGYGSWINLKNTDWANGKIKFNILLYDLKPMAVLFRYEDKDNYYAVEFSGIGTENVKFLKNIEGAATVIATKSVKILPRKWYRVVLIMDYDKIKVKIQSHVIREKKTIFFKEIANGLSRGSLAFASRGNSKFYINGINIDEYKPNRKDRYNNNKRSWNKVLRFLSPKQRKIYCNDMFKLLKEEIPRCMQIHTYCRIKCDKVIPPVESILNFSCQRDCVRTANILENKKDELSRLAKIDQWIPKRNQKIDFLPNGEKNYRMGFVREVESKKGKMVIIVEYLIHGNKTAKGQINFPSKNIKQCGEVLTARRDCIQK